MEAEDKVQLADVAEIPVENFDVVVDHLEGKDLVVRVIDTHAEIQTRIPSIHELLPFLPLDEIAHVPAPRQNLRHHIPHNPVSLLQRVWRVVLAQPQLPLSTITSPFATDSK